MAFIEKLYELAKFGMIAGRFGEDYHPNNEHVDELGEGEQKNLSYYLQYYLKGRRAKKPPPPP